MDGMQKRIELDQRRNVDQNEEITRKTTFTGGFFLIGSSLKGVYDLV